MMLGVSTTTSPPDFAATAAQRPMPQPTPETEHFWAGTREHRLLLQRCDACAHAYFPPRPFCPACGDRSVSVFEASGRATLHTYVINQRPGAGFDGPVALAIVELEEGPRMMTNIAGVARTEETLELDMALEPFWLQCTDQITLPLFQPASGHA